MKQRFTRTVSILCLAVLTVVATAGGQGGGKLAGTWTATSAISRGKPVPQEDFAKAMVSFTFKDGKYSIQANGEQVESGTYKVDAAKQPATIDLTVGKGADKEGAKHLGIYKIEGDSLTLAIAMPHTFSTSDKNKAPLPRPKTFEGKGKDDEVMVLKRAK